MGRGSLVRKPVSTERYPYSTGNVTTAAWVEIVSSTQEPFDAMEIFDSSGRILRISTGGSGDEDAGEIPYTVLPGGSGILIPWNLKKGSRISAKAVDGTATGGYMIINFFG